jgi:hypothetical protein
MPHAPITSKNAPHIYVENHVDERLTWMPHEQKLLELAISQREKGFVTLKFWTIWKF